MTMALVQTITVAAGGSSSITFSNIPQDATDLFILIALRDSSTSNGNDVEIRANSSSSGYTFRTLWGNGSTVGRAGSGSGAFYATFSSQSNNLTSNTFSNIGAYFSNYASTAERKMASIDAVTENNATSAYHTINSGMWDNTSAITSLSISLTGQTLLENSTASLYKITKA